MPSSPPTSAANIAPSSSPQPLNPHALSSDAEPNTQTAGEADSDTEIEDNAAAEAYYLSVPYSQEGDVGTIFGKEIRVWKSHRGTVYTHIIGETIDGTVRVPQKRDRVQWHTAQQVTTCVPEQNRLTLPARIPARIPSPTALRSRNPLLPSTVFHRGSAAINPLGANIRAPSRVKRSHSPPPELPLQSPSAPLPGSSHEEMAMKRRRIASGSFGTFESAGRFDERPYRLFPARGEGCVGREERGWECDG